MNKTLSIRQVGILTVFCVLSNKILLLPSLLFESSGTDALFSLVIAFAVDFVLVPVFIFLKTRFPDQDFYEIISQKSAFCAKFIHLLLMLFMFIKALLTFSIVYVYFKQEIYQEEFLLLILVCMLPVITHGVIKGIRTISRTMELFFAVVIAGFVLCNALSFFTPISFPIFFTHNFGNIFSSAFRYFVVFDDFIFLYVIFDKIDLSTGKLRNLYYYAMGGIVLVLGMFFVFYSKYPVTAFMHDNALADLMVFSVQFSSIGRLDILAMITIMTITLFQMEIYSYGFSRCFERVFDRLNRKHAMAFFDVAFVLIFTLYVGNHTDIVQWAQGWFSIVAGVVFVLVLLASIILLIRGKNEKD